MSKAVLLVNLGSPDSTSVSDVKRYLDEFLTDERVIDKAFVRKVIVPLIILNTRPKKSAEAYASVWTDEGSPLIVTSEHQAEKLGQSVAPKVYLAMRYGNPSIANVISQILKDGVTSLYVIPLYPQYAMSSYETVVVKVMEEINQQKPDLDVSFLQPFYNDPDYLDILAESIGENLPEGTDKLVFSFHGIPERHLRVSDPSHAHCLCVKDCCTRANPAHATCYKHQCLMTVKGVVERLKLPEDKYFVSFQSRLGRDPWLTPYTDATLARFGREGVKKVRVVCPAFVTDCLETLEEIAEEAKEIFEDAGGEDFAVIPCLNEDDRWIQYLAKQVEGWLNS
ncbi:ferrochelatase [Puniceicoccales bacterium CK1056]|uniref:Ferrochelatase n=1 Tax=Oceanipulchritudo coccoides TaxID=2706888 RepID=A0A6B2M453_9BACT|nr:ferrochelatase [Oceanipulchritudo coccoides]NDV63126.1 ferrochelatase [Oceanipulchritudo coccoides]